MSAVVSGARLPQAPPAADPTPCLIVNPRSFAASRSSMAARAAALARSYGIEVIEAQEPVALAAALDGLAVRGRQRIFLLAGDGTVHAAAEHLARRSGAERLPEILLLGGGRTNLIPGDLGARGSALKRLEAALARWRAGEAFEVEERFTLKVEQGPAAPRHGFFIAAGVVDSIIRACHRTHSSGPGLLREGHLGTAWTLLRLAVRGMGRGRSFPLHALEVDVPGAGVLPGPARLLIATTLQRRQGLLDPYADRGEGGVRVTAVAARGRSFWGLLPRMAAGLFAHQMSAERGYLSGRCHGLSVLGLSSYTLDGEEFEADPARPVMIGEGRRLRFLKP